MRQTKKLMVMMLALVLVLTALVSCNIGTNKPSTNTPGTNTIPTTTENLIFSSTVIPTIVCNETESLSKAVEELQLLVHQISGRTPSATTDQDYPVRHEIVLGKTSREISEKAYVLLERMEHEEEGNVGYIIYSDGASVAIACDEDRYQINAAAFSAVAAFVADFADTKTVAIPKGVYSSDSLNALAYQQAIDDADTEAEWRQFEYAVYEMGGDGKAVADAVKLYYERVCTDNLISWFANLYDPAVGGYYFSNSARNTPGYLPDSESTQQALGQFESSGMFDMVDVSDYDGPGYNLYMCGLPEWFRTQIIRFLKSLQDPETGFFYHPQWTKEEVNSKLTARSRHMSRAVGILNYFGSAPTYDTPNGDKGDGIKWDGTLVSDEAASPVSRLTGRLIYERSAVIAASKVRPTAAVAAHLQNDKTFLAYLNGLLTSKSSFYAIGSEIGQQESQIITRDEQLAAEGADYRLGDILIEWYSSYQNTETGLWDDGISYANSDAILKIGGTYTTFGYIFPNADKALTSLSEILMSDEVPGAVVNVYNVWYAIANTIENVNKFASSADKEYANQVRKTLLDLAPEAIKLSMEKQMIFKHEDGSFGYTVGQNCQTSSGVPVAPPGNGEGDVNATVICTAGTINNCLKALGLKSYAPGYFTEADRLRYIAILEDLGPVIKDDVSVAVQYETFDADPLGNAPANVTFSKNNHAKGELTVVEKGEGFEYGDYAMLFDHKSKYYEGAYEVVTLPTQSAARNASCFVLEGDFMVKSYASDDGSIATTITQLLIQPGVHMIAIQSDENGKIYLNEGSSTSWSKGKFNDLGYRFELGEWFNLKVEYYIGDHDTVRIKIFVNGELAAITDNYYDANGIKMTGIGKPAQTMDSLSIVGISTITSELLVDNIALYKTEAKYQRPMTKDEVPPICVDPLDKEQIIFNFDDNKMPEQFTAAEKLAGNLAFENGALHISGNTQSFQLAPRVELPINVLTGSAKVAVLEADITVDPTTTGRAQRFWFTSVNETKEMAICFDLQVITKDGKKYTAVAPAPNGNQGDIIEGTEVELGTTFTLRLEYFERERATLVYINDKLIALSSALCSNAEKYPAKVLVIQGTSGSPFDVTIDNLIFEKAVIDFKEATASDSERVNHTFDKVPDGATLSGGASVQNGVLNIGSVGSSIKLPLNERSFVPTAGISAFKIINNGKDSSYVMTYLTEDGKEVMCVEIEYNAGAINIYEYYAGGRGMRLGSLNAGIAGNTFELKYFYKDAKLNVYVDGEAAATTALTYLYDRDGLVPSYFVIEQKSGVGSVEIDDCYTESTADVYTIESVNTGDKPVEEPILTFETSGLDSYPKAITHKFLVGSSLAVKAVITKDNTASKMLAMTTVPGNNDAVRFPLQEDKKVEDAKAFVIEADLMFVAVPGQNTGIQLFFRDAADKNAMNYTIYAEDGKEVNISDWNGNKKQGGDHKIGVMEEELFNLRVEYVVIDSKLTTNFFVNDVYAFTSEVYTPDDKPFDASIVTKAMFYSLGAASTTLYMDNVSVYQTNEPTPITAPAE